MKFKIYNLECWIEIKAVFCLFTLFTVLIHQEMDQNVMKQH